MGSQVRALLVDGTDTPTGTTANPQTTVATGNVASGTADSGNGVKVAGVYQAAGALGAVTGGARADLQTDSRGNLRIAPTGAPIAPGITGTQYAFTLSNVSNLGTAPTAMPMAVGQFLWDGTNTIPGRTITGAVADGTGLGVTAVEEAGALFANITTATTVNAQKSGKGILHKLIINTFVASATITLYDSLTATGTKIGTITLPSTITSDAPVSLVYDLQFSTGLTIVTSGATDITVIYR